MNYNSPDARGKYGIYGGRFVSETLMESILDLEEKYTTLMKDDTFITEYNALLKNYVGRETPLYFAKNLTQAMGGCKIYLKREDLNHTGAHKINNALGQALITKHLGKSKVVAETGAGQHGVATATACALLGLKCKVFMGEEDIKRQSLNVYRMKVLGAEVVSVTSGSRVLKDATNEALRYWVANIEDTHYIIGSVIGPHPYPLIVRNFQSIIGKETKKQFFEAENQLPDTIVACVGGGSNAIGMFHPFITDSSVKLIGVEAAGLGVDTNSHAATVTKGSIGALHGSMMYLLQENDGQIKEAYSISAGLDYPGIGPEHCYLKDINRISYESITDNEAIHAFNTLSKFEGIIPALESSHAVAHAMKIAKKMQTNKSLIICLSGRGDKDVITLLNREDNHND